MPLRFNCQNCDARIRVPDGSEGRKVRCPRCGALQHVQAKPQVKVTVRAEQMRDFARGLEARAAAGAPASSRLSVDSPTAVSEPAPLLRDMDDDPGGSSDNDDSAPWVLRPPQEAEASAAPVSDAPPDHGSQELSGTQPQVPPAEKSQPVALKLTDEEASLEPSAPTASPAPDSPAQLRELAPVTAAPPDGSPALQASASLTADHTAQSPAPDSQAAAAVPVACVQAAPSEGLPLFRPQNPQPPNPASAAPAAAAVESPLPAAKPSRPLRPILPPLPQYVSLLTVAWTLRFLAAMAVGGVLRVIDAHRQSPQGMAVTFRDLLWGLIGVTLVWAAAEMVAAVRDLLIRGAREAR